MLRDNPHNINYTIRSTLREMPVNSSDFLKGIHYFEQQLDTQMPVEEKAILLSDIGALNRIAGNLDASAKQLREADALFPKKERPYYVNKIRMAQTLQFQEKYDAANDLYAQLIQVIDKQPELEQLRHFVHQHQGKNYFEQGALKNARKAFHLALALRKQLQIEELIESTEYALRALGKVKIELIGEKIKLRDWILDDLDDRVTYYEGDREWMKLNGPYFKRLTAGELRYRNTDYRIKIMTRKWTTPRKRLVIADPETNKFMGTVSWYWISEETNWMAIGILLYDDKKWGQGIGFDALKLWVSYLFELCPEIVRLDLRTWSGNTGMIKLAEKLGFKEEARFRKARIVDGKYYDGIGMGILREEWGF